MRLENLALYSYGHSGSYDAKQTEHETINPDYKSV